MCNYLKHLTWMIVSVLVATAHVSCQKKTMEPKEREQEEGKRVDLFLKHVDSGLIKSGMNYVDIKKIYKDDVSLDLYNDAKTPLRGTVNFKYGRSNFSKTGQAPQDGWGVFFAFDSKGKLLFFTLSNTSGKGPRQRDLESLSGRHKCAEALKQVKKPEEKLPIVIGAFSCAALDCDVDFSSVQEMFGDSLVPIVPPVTTFYSGEIRKDYIVRLYDADKENNVIKWALLISINKDNRVESASITIEDTILKGYPLWEQERLKLVK